MRRSRRSRLMVDVTKYESLKYWDSQWQVELYPDKWQHKNNYSDGKAIASKEKSKSC